MENIQSYNKTARKMLLYMTYRYKCEQDEVASLPIIRSLYTIKNIFH